ASAASGHGGGPLAGPLASLPPLLTLERLLFRILAAGFVLLTATLATGVLFSEELFGQALRFNHKTLFALLSWVIFGGLLVGRWRYGWRGRKALRWTLAGFVALLLAYVGSRFVLEVVLGRSLA
ncbi:MAG: cytochrome C assembly family protein, partial [Burkholderiales bacterium]